MIALFFSLLSFFDRKINTRTGRAEWIWIAHDFSSRAPVAFAAVAEFTPPPDRMFAHLLLSVRPEHTLYVNGTLVGAAAVGEPQVHRYEIGPFLREGSNRIVVVARAADGVGGVLATVDYGNLRRDMMSTPGNWRVTRDIGQAMTAPLATMDPPVSFGPPPAGPWNYPRLVAADARTGEAGAVPASSVASASLVLPEISILSGVAVMRPRPTAARIFDFGPTAARIRFDRAARNDVSTVEWRTANDPSEFALEARPSVSVLAGGENTYTTPDVERFRYVIVYDEETEVSAVAPD